MAFKVFEELHICFDRELTLTATCKLTLVLLQDEWPSAQPDAHDPEPPTLDCDRISSSASESSLYPAHDSDNDRFGLATFAGVECKESFGWLNSRVTVWALVSGAQEQHGR